MAKVFSSNRASITGASPINHPTITFAEVAQVLLDSDDPSFNPPGNINIGSIKARLLDTERGKASEDLTWYAPLNMNDIHVPVIGEVVMLVQAPNRNIVKSKKSVEYYYISIVSTMGNATNNAIKGFSKPIAQSNLVTYTGNQNTDKVDGLGDYIPEIAKSNLIAFEGDKLIQGRWGHGIRFTNTSNGSSKKTFWNKDGNDGDPLIVISNGHASEFPDPYLEAIDDDASTIVLSSAQSIDLSISDKVHPSLQSINQYSAGQIILNSDRVVLNSKADGVIIAGKTGVYITTPDWKTDFNELMDIFKELIAEMKSQAEGSSPFTTGVGPTGPNPASIAILTLLETRLGLLEQ
jgi:DNA-binding cell septation regulator SpoVG